MEGDKLAMLIRAIGGKGSRVEPVRPANGRSFTLKELQDFVGGYIEPLCLKVEGEDGAFVMFLNEDGKALRLPRNEIADRIAKDAAHISKHDYIVGDVVIASRREAGYDDYPDAA